MITKRTLENWRKDALRTDYSGIVRNDPESINIVVLKMNDLNQRILRLTQELIDLQLVKKG